MTTFLATASGMALFGLGSAFWIVVIGMPAHVALHHGRGLPTCSARTQAPGNPEKLDATPQEQG